MALMGFFKEFGGVGRNESLCSAAAVVVSLSPQTFTFSPPPAPPLLLQALRGFLPWDGGGGGDAPLPSFLLQFFFPILFNGLFRLVFCATAALSKL